MLKFDKQKFLQIAKTQGASSAITALHRELGGQSGMEFQAFEGQKGWQPEAWEDIKAVREFSRELWAIDLDSIKNK